MAKTEGSMINLKVLTPEGSILEGAVSYVALPGSEGELGILPMHTALLARLAPGSLSYKSPEGPGIIAVGRGVVEVRNDLVTVLVENAVLEEAIDVNVVEARRRRLLEDSEDRSLDEEQRLQIQEELLQLDVQLQIAGKRAAPTH